MRTLSLLVGLCLVLPLATLTLPTTDAFGWCTAIGPEGHRCSSHTACIGWGWDSRGEHCQYGVKEIDWCRYFCTNGPPLP